MATILAKSPLLALKDFVEFDSWSKNLLILFVITRPYHLAFRFQMGFLPHAVKLIHYQKFACMSRCLIKASEIKKTPITPAITPDEFRAKYDKFFPANHYGGLILSDFLFIAKDFKLGDKADFCFEYGKAADAFNRDKVFIFIFSGIDLNKGCSGDLNHCSILTSIDRTAGFSIWTPSSDGTDHTLPFPMQEWHDKKFCALTVWRSC